MTVLKRGLALLGAISVAACTTMPKLDLGGPAESAARFKADLTTLSGDDYEGRESGTPGYLKAADYVEAEFKRIGLKPAGLNGTYRQEVPLRRAVAVTDASAMTLTADAGTVELIRFNDYVVSPSFVDSTFAAEGEVVFMGYGVDAPQFGHTAYREIDVTGKIVAVLNGAPSGLPSEESAHLGSGRTKMDTAIQYGAAGMVTLINFDSPGRLAQFATRPAEFVKHPPAIARMDARGLLTRSGINKLTSAAGVDADALLAGQVAPGPLGVSLSLAGETTFEDFGAPNVLGMIPGSDRSLKKEYVVLTAHLDHIGKLRAIAESPDADLINNGAMDNASGTATMLEAARKFVAEGVRPKRSVIFLSLAAEEKGLLGSEYFAKNPTVPQGSMVANVNLDMPILLHEFTDVIAFGAEHSSLKGLVTTAAAGMGVALTPDPIPEQVLFVRSDHYNFVKAGVPSVFLVLGFASGGDAAFQSFISTHYHRPSDQSDLPILWDQGARFAELNYRIAKEIANAAETPSWNEGDFFGDTFAPKDGM